MRTMLGRMQPPIVPGGPTPPTSPMPAVPGQPVGTAKPQSSASPWSIVLAVVGGVTLLLGCGLMGASVASNDASPSTVAAPEASTVTRTLTVTRTVTVEPPPPPEPTTPPPPAAPEIREGVWTVGVDIPPGTYRTIADVGSSCYWEISKTGGDGGIFDIIDNDLPGGGRPQVSLQVGQDFKTNRCGTWQKID